MEKVVLITGASGGMGTALANLFAGQNVKMALHYNSNPITIEESDSIAHFQADLTKESEALGLVENVVKRFGRIDVLINNAGISKSSISWKTDADAWRATMAINLDAAFYTSKGVTNNMRKQNSGRIINISSVVAQTGFIGTAAYAASKAGLIGLTKTLSKELISSGISVNVLALGYFSVGMIDDVPEELRKEVINSIPAKQLGDPATVFKTIQWLMSDEGAYVTGQTINLNGGLYS
ncbi:MAG: SDR family NAD(P)-dependent oxidoreductase [Crocinitomicaceae bacterium]|nr:SDR family NAD(P)-dependent oxidoreductase [Crocinitomicaceae bacterium]